MRRSIGSMRNRRPSMGPGARMIGVKPMCATRRPVAIVIASPDRPHGLGRGDAIRLPYLRGNRAAPHALV